jgi:hypothetical protein
MNRSSSIPAFIILKMIKLLETQGWCQHIMASDEMGHPVELEDKNAWSFSLVGAFYYTMDKYPQATKFKEQVLTMILHSLNKRKSAEGLLKAPSDIIKDRAAKSDEWKHHFNVFNDAQGRTKSEVIRMLQDAVED